ncbi:MAG: hypothetical protein V1792_07305 [Pseudomonadota bacterium]
MTPGTYLSRVELAERWRMSIKTVDRLRSSGCLPWIDVSGGRGARPIVRIQLHDVIQFEERMRSERREPSEAT